MMRQPSHSSSPFHSSADSSSPPSPPDSTWSYHCSQVSPLTSSISSPSSSSSSLLSSPQLSSQTPLAASLPHHGEKPGGKRKYKSRHLDGDNKDPTWRPSGSGRSRERRRESREKDRTQRGRDRRRKGARRESGGDGSSRRRRRDERSPSVEIIYEGTINATQTPARRRRRRKRPRRTQHSSSPVIITLDSSSSHDDHDNNGVDSSSPLSSQQTVDFSDLPPLPLMHSAGVGGALNAEFGELPADILDGSETEPAGQSQAVAVAAAAAGPISVEHSDSSGGEVDVEKVEESGSELASDEGHGPKRGAGPASGEEREAADSHLLATILNDLKGITPSTSKPNESSDEQGGELPERTRAFPGFSEEKDDQIKRQRRGCDSPSVASPSVASPSVASPSVASPPPLEQQKEARVREEGTDMPPLLKQASPVRSHNRNTPPPLKHKDASSPRLLPVPAAPPTSGDDPPPVHTIPPFSSLKRRSALTPPTGSKSAAGVHSSFPLAPFHLAPPPEGGAWNVGLHPTSNRPPADSSSARFVPHQNFSSSSSNSRRSTQEVSPPGDALPVAPDFQSARMSRSNEKVAHTDSASRGCREQTLSPNSCQAAPVILHPSSTPGRGVSSEGDLSNASRQKPSAPVDSLSSCQSENLSSSAVSGVLTGASVERLPKDPKCTRDLHAASKGRSASANQEDGFPTCDFNSSSRVPSANERHSNHTASSSPDFLSRLSQPLADSNAALLRSDSKPLNHVDPTSERRVDAGARCEQTLSADSRLKEKSRRDFELAEDDRSSDSSQDAGSTGGFSHTR